MPYGGLGVRLDAVGAAAQQAWPPRPGCRAPVGQTDRELGQPLPEVALGVAAPPSRCPRAPRGRGTAGRRRAAAAPRQRLVGRQHQVVGHPLDALGAVRQRPAEPVAGPGVAGRPAGSRSRPVPAQARSPAPAPGRASQPSSSVVNAAGSSSCGKCPTPGISRQRYGASTYRPEPCALARQHAAVQRAVQLQGRAP